MSTLDPRVAADEVLTLCWKDMPPPVDPYEIAKKMGVEVKLVSAKPNVAGGLLREKGRAPIIFLNSEDHPNRRRFTCAHELGHYYSRFREQEYEYMDYRDALSSNGTDPDEIFANQFAGNLLMPEVLVRSVLKEAKKRFENENTVIMALAGRFQVSTEAMNVRLKVLNIVSS